MKISKAQAFQIFMQNLQTWIALDMIDRVPGDVVVNAHEDTRDMISTLEDLPELDEPLGDPDDIDLEDAVGLE